MSIEENIFKRKEVNFDKVKKYGFKKTKDKWEYKKNFMNGEFEAQITIFENGEVIGKVIDASFGDEYTNFRIENVVGKFVNEVKENYINILNDIALKCYEDKYFIFNQTNRIANKLFEIYGDKPDFPWDDFSGAVFRNPNNSKWYGLIMNITDDKLDLRDKDIKSNKKEEPTEIEVLNIKLDEDEINDLVKKDGFYRAYHMNKKSWITIILDESLKDDYILSLIAESHKFTEFSNEWVIPSSSDYGFDIKSYFESNKLITWNQTASISKGDTVYIYAGKPYSAILYKTIAKETNIPITKKMKEEEPYYAKYKFLMKLEVVAKYKDDAITFSKMKELGVRAVRGPRRLTDELSEYIRTSEKE